MTVDSILRSSTLGETAMGNEEAERRKRHRAECHEYDRILEALDYQDQRDLASHLLVAANYKKGQRKRPKTANVKYEDVHTNLVIYDTWTSWPMPSSAVRRPLVIPSSSHNAQELSSSALQAEIKAAILRIARLRIQHDSPSLVSSNEHPPYDVTRQVTSQVMAKLNRLRHALGRIKQQVPVKTNLRYLKSRCDEIVGVAGISQCVDNPETMNRVKGRCNKLFNEDMCMVTLEDS